MKEAYYFPHDANARTDARILELRAELGWKGYGLWWALVEQLREATEYRLNNTLIGGLAVGLALPKEEVRALIDLCLSVGLLALDGENFFSPSLCRRMITLDAKRLARTESAKNAAAMRWQKDSDANAMRTHEQDDAPAMRNDATVEESKGEESRGKKKRTGKGPAAPPASLSERFHEEVANLDEAKQARWAKFVAWEKENPLTAVFAMPKPLLPEQFFKLIELFPGKGVVSGILLDMENWAFLHKKKSAYLTASKWLSSPDK